MASRTTALLGALLTLAIPGTASAAAPLEVLTTLPNKSLQANTEIPAGSSALKVDERGNLLVGPNELAGGYIDNFTLYEDTPFVPDFAYRADTRRIYSRSLVLAEQGDSPDLALGRVGPDNSYPLATAPAGIPDQTRLGGMYFRGWAREGGFNNRVAEISSWTQEAITKNGAGGDLRFSTAPLGKTQSVVRVILDPAGGVNIREATTVPATPKNGDGVVLYVKDGRLMMLDQSGASTPLAGTAGAPGTTTIEHHYEQTPASVPAAPDSRVAVLQRKVDKLSHDLTSLQRAVRKLQKRR